MNHVFNRRVRFLEPNPTGETSPTGANITGEPIPYDVWAERRDGGGSEGFPAERVAGGRWDREYYVRSESFPAGRIPGETWNVLDDGVLLAISSVDEEDSVSRRIVLRISAYRSKSVRGSR